MAGSSAIAAHKSFLNRLLFSAIAVGLAEYVYDAFIPARWGYIPTPFGFDFSEYTTELAILLLSYFVVLRFFGTPLKRLGATLLIWLVTYVAAMYLPLFAPYALFLSLFSHVAEWTSYAIDQGLAFALTAGATAWGWKLVSHKRNPKKKTRVSRKPRK